MLVTTWPPGQQHPKSQEMRWAPKSASIVNTYWFTVSLCSASPHMALGYPADFNMAHYDSTSAWSHIHPRVGSPWGTRPLCSERPLESTHMNMHVHTQVLLLGKQPYSIPSPTLDPFWSLPSLQCQLQQVLQVAPAPWCRLPGHCQK